LLSACSAPKEPEFNRMENTLIQKITSSEIIVLTDAVFDNPNGFGVTVSSIDLVVKANDVEAAKIKQMADVEMIGKTEFAIPLEIKLSPKKMLSLENALKLVLGSLEKKVELSYQGTTTLKIMNISYEIPIDYSEEILLQK
jgi:LEA14-like dessication related protein